MDKTSLYRQDSGIELDERYEHQASFFDLPPEVRTCIYQLVFSPEESRSNAFHNPTGADRLNELYHASNALLPLLTCRQFHADANLLAFSRTTFVVRNPFTAKDLPHRLTSRLRPQQIASVRSIAFVAEADHFRQMRNWKGRAFGVPELRLDELGILLYRSSYSHYLFDFNTLVVDLLRGLEGVRRITYFRNESRVKPHFHTWFNRLAAAILKVDRFERFGKGDGLALRGRLEKVWWEWEFDASAQTASLFARPAKGWMALEEYDGFMRGVREELAESLRMEEYDPDPRARNGF